MKRINFVSGNPYILCLFDYKATTGFATVSQNIIRELHRRFYGKLCFDIIPINYFDPKQLMIQENQHTRIFPILANEYENDPLGRFAFLRLLNNGAYKGYFIIHDPGTAFSMIQNLQEIDRNYRSKGLKRPKSLIYFPVDGEPLDLFFPKTIGSNFSYFDRLVTYTEYGKERYLSKQPTLKDKLQVIPHGCNAHEFYQMSPEDRNAARRDLFGENAEKIIIANINRNQFRKDIPYTLLGYQKFLDKYPEFNGKAFLYLHMHPADLQGWDLRLVADQLKLTEGKDYGFPPKDREDHNFSVKELCGLYNSIDLYLTTATGEGWGLTVTEAMMCGCPVAIPYHTSLIEIGGRNSERAWHMPALWPYFATNDSVLRYQVSPTHVAETIYEALTDKHTTLLKADAALEYMRKLTWDKICDRWEVLFKDLFL